MICDRATTDGLRSSVGPSTSTYIFTGPSSAVLLRLSMKNNHGLPWESVQLSESVLDDLKWPVHLVPVIHEIDGPASKICPLVHLKTIILKFWSFVHRDIIHTQYRHRQYSGVYISIKTIEGERRIFWFIYRKMCIFDQKSSKSLI